MGKADDQADRELAIPAGDPYNIVFQGTLD